MFCCLPVVQRRELEYDKHLRDKMIVAKNEFRALLRETKMITYRLVLGPFCVVSFPDCRERVAYNSFVQTSFGVYIASSTVCI